MSIQITPQSSCPQCGGSTQSDPGRGEIACSECGTILEDEAVDHGPEWTAYSSQEYDEKSRVGAPTTQMLHDKGLTTQIGWKNKDAKGRSLSKRKRTQLGRLRKWHTRCQTYGGKERNLKQAFSEINRMASALGLPESVRETASVIYRRAVDANLLLGRSIEAVASATLYAAARTENIPRTLDEIAAVARMDADEIGQSYRTVGAELELAIEPSDPRDYLPRFASELDCSHATHKRSRELLDTVVGTEYMSGKNPVGLAAAALYASACLTGERLTQQAISDVSGITSMTIRTHYTRFLNNE